jgi:hypothetical protein
MSNSPWDSDFGSIFKQRYTREMLNKHYEGDIKKGIGGVLAGGSILPGIAGAAAGSEIEDAVTGAGKKQDESTDSTIAPKVPKEVGELVEAAPEIAETAALAAMEKSLRKANLHLQKFLAKAAGKGATAGLNIKNVTQSKGKAYPTKPAPKPKNKKGC